VADNFIEELPLSLALLTQLQTLTTYGNESHRPPREIMPLELTRIQVCASAFTTTITITITTITVTVTWPSDLESTRVQEFLALLLSPKPKPGAGIPGAAPKP